MKDEMPKVRPIARRVKGTGWWRYRKGSMVIWPSKLRYSTAKRWAERRTRDELIEAVAVLFRERLRDREELQARYTLQTQSESAQAMAARGGRAKRAKNPEQQAIAAAKREAHKQRDSRDSQ